MSGKNAGFVLATPVGLVGAGAFAGVSGIEYGVDASVRIVRNALPLLAGVLAALFAWGVVFAAGLTPPRCRGGNGMG